MAYVYEKPFSSYFVPGTSNCVGAVDANGYIYNSSNMSYGPGSSNCVGSIDTDGYVFNCSYVGRGPGSSNCVGSVSPDGYVYTGSYVGNGPGSSSCVGSIDSDGYVYTASYVRKSPGSDCCIGKVDGFGREAMGGAALLLLLNASTAGLPVSNTAERSSSSGSCSHYESSTGSSYSSYSSVGLTDILEGIVAGVGTILLWVLAAAAAIAVLVGPFLLLFKLWGVFD